MAPPKRQATTEDNKEDGGERRAFERRGLRCLVIWGLDWGGGGVCKARTGKEACGCGAEERRERVGVFLWCVRVCRGRFGERDERTRGIWDMVMVLVGSVGVV